MCGVSILLQLDDILQALSTIVSWLLNGMLSKLINRHNTHGVLNCCLPRCYKVDAARVLGVHLVKNLGSNSPQEYISTNGQVLYSLLETLT